MVITFSLSNASTARLKYNCYVSRTRILIFPRKWGQTQLREEGVLCPLHSTPGHCLHGLVQLLLQSIRKVPGDEHMALLDRLRCHPCLHDSAMYFPCYSVYARISKSFPLNFAVLGLFTLGESYLVSTVCSMYTASSVLLSAVATLSATLGLTYYAITTTEDYTSYRSSSKGTHLSI